MHYYKFNIADWAKDTSHLSLKEEAIYFRLINFYYDHEKPIPIKTQSVLRKLRMGDESETVEIILDEFFTKTPDGWTHSRCDKLVAEYQKRADANRKNGKLGGRNKNNDLPKATGLSMGNEENPDGSEKEPTLVNHKPLTTNHKPRTIFTPPSADDAQSYFQERGFGEKGVGQKFVNHYEANGWMRGKNKIKDWKACVRTWCGNMKPVPSASKPIEQVKYDINRDFDLL
jgi:uncharacterized protein YdaU (DUF1376 family)